MSIYDHPVKTLGGDAADLHDYEGKVALVVNVASKCGLTPQYEGLERLQATYADRGFAVLGFPCNQFGGQEPGTSEEIATFCSTTYGIDFPMTEKVDVKGDDAHPFYKWAVAEVGEPAEPVWNFHKLLVGKDGKVINVFGPRTEPRDPEVVAAIEAAL